jgi:hypothetical protein
VDTLKGKFGEVKGKVGEYGSKIKDKVVEKAGDVREAVATGVGKVRDWDNTSYANTYSELLIVELDKYFKGEEFQALKKTDPAPETPVKLNFGKSEFYSLPAWNLMIDKVRDFLIEHPSVSPDKMQGVQQSLENMRASTGTRDLPYYDVSNVEVPVLKLAAAREARRRELQAQEAAASGNNNGQPYTTASTAAMLFYGGGRSTRTKRFKPKRYTRRR